MTERSSAGPAGVRWQRVNSEPFEYAIQQGPHGDEFVKLLDGTCLRRRPSFDDDLVNRQCKLGDYCKCCAGKPRLCPNYEGPGALAQQTTVPATCDDLGGMLHDYDYGPKHEADADMIGEYRRLAAAIMQEFEVRKTAPAVTSPKCGGDHAR